ncbi:FMN-binding split barrel [Akanthomyces lecanii RCEF 1005]|uniref:FMN-binding split barrel n=1 Tax=Akanthomyces lecanii RCEF 1005 TaxID=1081108 RepID=A0A168IAG8_CORDF|nr:FMN-binding split barrel [Akanthomyces lecanii RCEF 1005]
MPARLETFHEGETAMRSLLKVPPGRNPTAAGLPPSYGLRVVESPLVAVGTLDAAGQPWTTLWGGARGFAEPIAQDVLGLNSSVDAAHDPVYHALWGGDAARGGVVQPNGGRGKMMAALAVDLESRDRVKLMGSMVAGTREEDKLQMAFLVTESLGNCPKYLNKKRVAPRAYGADTEVVEDKHGRVLPGEAVGLLDNADMFFLSSTDGNTMDTNHRGGPAGFVRVLKNEADEAVLVYPEYSGNRLYQTLGNLRVNPLVGIVVPDFATADVLYLTGTASILVGAAAASVIARTQLAVQVTVSSARFVRRGLPFLGTPLERSPYNPPVRHLLAEQSEAKILAVERPDVTATLTHREALTPTVSRFTFTLDGEGEEADKMRWVAGQHVTLDFGEELNHGYAHMRDDDPQSLNDDFVRTFTVSSPPLPPSAGKGKVQMQITARRNGPATGLLWRQNMRVPLKLPVLGFGGASSFHLPTTASSGTTTPVFVAGGVGITPLLAQARGVLDADVPLTLLWSLNSRDLALAEDTFARIEGLAAKTTVFVSGSDGDAEVVERIRQQGVKGIEFRRIGEGDVKKLGGGRGKKTKFYLCTGPTLLRALQDWLDGEDVVWEDFGY